MSPLPCRLWIRLLVMVVVVVSALALDLQSTDRRSFLTQSGIVSAGAIMLPSLPAHAESLSERLAARDPSKLTNSLFNKPPAAMVYPGFMRSAIWDVQAQFGGYLFPSTKIPKDQLLAKATTPGFQKCSIAAISDIGREGTVQYAMHILPNGLEDRAFTLKQQIDAYLGYPAVSEVLYNAKANPNRISIDFVDYKTINAERIELFCNGRESQLQLPLDNNSNGRDVFVHSEYIRQVTFGGGSEVGIPRQVSSNYAHFWTWSQPHTSSSDDNNNTPAVLKGNLLTAAYLDPQDPNFFEEPTKPVAVYSHVLKATKRGEAKNNA